MVGPMARGKGGRPHRDLVCNNTAELGTASDGPSTLPMGRDKLCTSVISKRKEANQTVRSETHGGQLQGKGCSVGLGDWLSGREPA